MALSATLGMVYPRVGGGTRPTDRRRKDRKGLSPRGRGNRSLTPARSATLGSIPAWAGEPQFTGWLQVNARVYPRVGGGTLASPAVSAASSGLSPRGRGNLHHLGWPGSCRRSIPAWAGEPRHQLATPRYPGVYPRVGGGTGLMRLVYMMGSGLSPRGRGNRGRCPGRTDNQGSIPAWAGEPSSSTSIGCGYTVYPRVGGGTDLPCS